MERLRRFPVFACLAVSALVTLGARAPATFQIVDAEGRPYAGAEVSVVGRSGSVITDGEGRFRLLAEPPPPFDLAVFDQRGTLIGVLRVESLSTPDSRRLVLEPAAREEITVLSGTAPATFATPAAAATVFSAEEYRERPPATLVEALEDIPGAEQVGSGTTAVPSLRGLARGRTLILLDDGRVTAERRAGPSATYLDPFSLESVEIVRGPGSVAYGSDAMGGIIHARTPQPRPDAFAGRFELAARDGENTGSAALELNLPAGRGAVLVQAHARTADDYEGPDGEVANSGSRNRGLLVRGRVPAGDRRMILGLQLDRGRDVGKAGSDTVYPIEDSDRLTLAAGLPVFGGLSSLELRAFAGSYRLVTDRPAERSDVDADDASLRLVGTRPAGPGSLRLGLDVSGRFNLRVRGTLFDVPPGGPRVPVSEDVAIDSARRIDWGLFAELERSLPGLPGSVSAGLRGDLVETKSSGEAFGERSTSNDSLSGYAALSWHPGPAWSTTLQYARGFRDPTLSDRYFSGVTGRGRVEGNPDLVAETSDQLDLAVLTRFGPVRVATYAYHYRIRDLVDRIRVDPDERLFRFVNRGSVELRGIEVETDVDLPAGLDLRFGLNWADGEVRDDDGRANPNDVPAESLGISLRRYVRGRHWWRLDLTAVARDDDPGGTERVTPGYAVLDASVGVTLRRGFELRLFVGNLLEREHPASADEDAPVGVGRSVGLTLAGTFGGGEEEAARDDSAGP